LSLRTFAKIGPGQLDSTPGESYLRPIPIHRLTGGAFVRASAFRLEGVIFSDEMGRMAPRGAEEG
jgi:hypothetical protein